MEGRWDWTIRRDGWAGLGWATPELRRGSAGQWALHPVVPCSRTCVHALETPDPPLRAAYQGYSRAYPRPHGFPSSKIYVCVKVSRALFQRGRQSNWTASRLNIPVWQGRPLRSVGLTTAAGRCFFCRVSVRSSCGRQFIIKTDKRNSLVGTCSLR